MNRKTGCAAMLLIALCMVLVAEKSHASGIGVYVEYASGSGSFMEVDRSQFSEDAIDVDVAGFGVVMDTNLLSPSPYNYRLSIGCDALDLPNGYGGSRISIDNTFGYGIVRNENFRLWVGPQAHLGYGQWDVPITSYYVGNRVRDNISFRSWGLGAVLGANIKWPGIGLVCPELGARYQRNTAATYHEEGFVYRYDREDDNWYEYHYTYDTDSSYDETVLFLKVSLMFGG